MDFVNLNDFKDKGVDADFAQSFSEKNIRKRFIAKVYSILTTQLFITFLMIFFVCNSKEMFTDFISKNMWIIYVVTIIYLITFYSLVCFKDLTNKVPQNYILLFTFTLCFAFLSSLICLEYDPQDVLIAFFMTFALSLILTLFAFNTSHDFTNCTQGLLCILFLLIIGSIIGYFFQSKIFQVLLSICFSIVYGLYLVVDTQLLIGKHSNKVDIDDYIFISLNLYIDIMNLFLELLKIIGNSDNN